MRRKKIWLCFLLQILVVQELSYLFQGLSDVYCTGGDDPDVMVESHTVLTSVKLLF